MFSTNKYRILFLFLSLFTCFKNTQAQNIDILFSGVRSTAGQIIVKIFIDDKGFQEDRAHKTVKFKKVGVTNGVMAVNLSLDPGIYGFALLDDENYSNSMNYGFFGLPDEGFGFSNFYLTGLKKPKFDHFKFTLNKDQKLLIQMKIRYL